MLHQPSSLLACSVLVLINYAKCDPNISSNNASIIIVGAGASGIAAATKLLENGFINVKLLEAEARLGGRIDSIPFGDALVDFGAEYCHGEKGNIVYSMASDALKSSKPEYVLYYSGDGLEVGIDVHELLFNLTHQIAHRKQFNASEHDPCASILSEGLCLKRQFQKLVNESKADYQGLLKQSYTWLKSYKSATESCLDLDDVSLVSEYEECEGDQMLGWQGRGFKTILDIMMRNNVVDVLLSNKVTTISNWLNGSKVDVLATHKEEPYEADHVIFTPSLGVLKADHRKLFSPPLPNDKTFAIENIGYGAIVKVALHFEKCWWTVHGPRMWGCIFSTDHNKELERQNLTWVKHYTAMTAAPGNPRVLLAWFSGEDILLDLEKISEYDILRGVRFILSKCFVNYFDIDMPIEIKRSQWWTNPSFRGSYSYDSVKGVLSGQRRLRDDLASPILNEDGVPVLLFAGEATHSTMFATVHGAIETGYREADRLINFYRMMR